MIINQRKFFKPTKVAHELAILECLSINSSLSQQELGNKTFLSGAMINQYLRNMRDAGLIQFVVHNKKTFRYELTTEGRQRHQAMWNSYSAELIQLYAAMKDNIRKRLAELLKRKKTRIILYGANNVAEIIFAALSETSFEVIALVDDDPQKHGRMFQRHIISHPGVIKSVNAHAILVTASSHQEDICASITLLTKLRSMEVVTI